MALRQVMEIPEQKKVYVKKSSTYDDDFLSQKVDLLEGKIAQTLPIFGTKLVEGLFEKSQVKEYLKALITEYFNGMHAYCFNELKSVVKARMSKDNYDFSFEKFKELTIELEKEYAVIEELGIEPTSVIDAFARNQSLWFQKSFSWGN
jgi:hypothetical protein